MVDVVEEVVGLSVAECSHHLEASRQTTMYSFFLLV